jgi:hypothetical protein
MYGRNFLRNCLHTRKKQYWLSFAVVKGLWALCEVMNMCVVITIAIVWLSFSVTGFWYLWDNVITVTMLMLLKKAFNLLGLYAALWQQCTEITDC